MWYRLLKDHDGKKAGTVVKIDDAGIAKALVTAAVCEEQKDYDPANQERDTMVKEIATSLQTMVKDTVASAVKQIAESLSKEQRIIITNGGGGQEGVDKLAAELGYKNWGEWMLELKDGQAKGASLRQFPRMTKYMNAMDEHFKALPTGLNETIGEDGGLLVPPEMSTEIFRRVNAVDASLLMSRVDKRTIQRNGISYPYLQENSRADGSRNGGVLGYWLGEGEQKTKSKPKWNSLEFRLNKFAILIQATDELMEDGPATLANELSLLAADEIQYRMGLAIWAGTGVKQPRGIMNSPALVTVTRTTTLRIKYEDIMNMYTRIPAHLRSQMVWFYNQDLDMELARMFVPVTNVAGTENVGGLPVYMPPNGISGSLYATILGRPAIALEYASALGTTGDIMACVPSQYRFVTKAGGIQSAFSMHLRFDYDEVVWRFVFRADGQSMWPTVFTPLNGTTKSPFVVLSTL